MKKIIHFLIIGLIAISSSYGQELIKPFPITRQVLLDSLNRAGAIYDTSGSGNSTLTGSGPRLLWIPGRSAFRAGEVAAAFPKAWDDSLSGRASAAFGYATTASGEYSFVEGYGPTASGRDAHAEGYETTASGTNAHAEGDNGFSAQLSSHSEGHYNTATGLAAHVEGAYSVASAPSSHAGGNHSLAYLDGQWAHASGLSSNNPGAAQASIIVLRARTTDASPVELKFGSGNEYIPATPPDKQLVVPANKAWFFRIYVVAKNSANDANLAAFRSEGVISNYNTSLTLMGGAVTPIAGQGSTLNFAVDVDNAAHALRLKGTGIDNTIMNWVAEVHLTEIAAD